MKTEAEILKRLTELHEQLDADVDWPSGTDLLEWVLAPSPVIHEGAEKHRCDLLHDGWLNKEKIFAEKWRATNNPSPFLNRGRGTLEWLLCTKVEGKGQFPGQRTVQHRHLTQEEATAAASAIQWLGTNCGWCWLEECLRECDMHIEGRREARCRLTECHLRKAENSSWSGPPR